MQICRAKSFADSTQLFQARLAFGVENLTYGAGGAPQRVRGLAVSARPERITPLPLDQVGDFVNALRDLEIGRDGRLVLCLANCVDEVECEMGGATGTDVAIRTQAEECRSFLVVEATDSIFSSFTSISIHVEGVK